MTVKVETTADLNHFIDRRPDRGCQAGGPSCLRCKLPRCVDEARHPAEPGELRLRGMLTPTAAGWSEKALPIPERAGSVEATPLHERTGE